MGGIADRKRMQTYLGSLSGGHLQKGNHHCYTSCVEAILLDPTQLAERQIALHIDLLWMKQGRSEA